MFAINGDSFKGICPIQRPLALTLSLKKWITA